MKNLLMLSVCAAGAFGLCTSALAYTGGAVTGGGTISGVVIKKGAAKDPMKKVTKDAAHCGETMTAEQQVVSASGQVRWAVAMLEGVEAGKPLDKDAKPVIDNKGCRFVPHVMVAPKGAKLTVRNSDDMLHNSHFYLVSGGKKKNVINLALPRKGQEIKKGKILRKAGLLSVLCDAHDFMQAYVWSLPHPYGAVTDAAGAFQLTDVPPGDYKLKVWHEAFGEKLVPVTVKAGETTKLEIVL